MRAWYARISDTENLFLQKLRPTGMLVSSSVISYANPNHCSGMAPNRNGLAKSTAKGKAKEVAALEEDLSDPKTEQKDKEKARPHRRKEFDFSPTPPDLLAEGEGNRCLYISLS